MSTLFDVDSESLRSFALSRSNCKQVEVMHNEVGEQWSAFMLHKISSFLCSYADSRIGVQGTTALAAALRVNTTVTTVHLQSVLYRFLCNCLVSQAGAMTPFDASFYN